MVTWVNAWTVNRKRRGARIGGRTGRVDGRQGREGKEED